MSKTNNYHYVPSCSKIASNKSRYTLLNRQQPIHTRISTNNERDRRPIDPPPIIQIKLNNPTPQQIDDFHQNSYFYMCANLAHPTDDNEIYTPTHNALSGQTVSSMYKLKDVNDQDGAFFIFGDISVKVEGAFRLKLSLFEITSTGSVCLDSIFTTPFIVYHSKKFPGMLDSTFLSRSFSDQGARIRIRKENRSGTKRKLPVEHERKCSITSSSSEQSHTPVSLPPLSPPQQSFDKLQYESPFITFSHPPSPSLTQDFSIKLPPIRTLSTTSNENDAIHAMIQLSHAEPARKKLFI